MVMIKIAGTDKHFRCECGCNVFKIKVKAETYTIYICNACSNEYCDTEEGRNIEEANYDNT